MLLENGSFSFYENDKVISTSEPLLKFLGDNFSIAITCDEKVDNQCTYIDDYFITCKPEGKDINTYDECGSYGISYSSNTISINDLHTPTGLGDLVTITVTSNPKDGTSAVTKSVDIEIFKHAVECNTFFKRQDETFSINRAASNIECSLNTETLTKGIHYETVTENGETTLKFLISSFDTITCTLNGNSEDKIKVYSQPACRLEDGNYLELPLYQSANYDETVWSETCTDNKVVESVCVYEPRLRKATLLKHETDCHDSESVPEGHGYVTLQMTLKSTNEGSTTVNAAFMPYWMKRLVEDAIENVSPVPMRNAYITNIKYDAGENSNDVTVVIDTAYEFAADLKKYLENNKDSFGSEINAKLSSEMSFFTKYSFTVYYVYLQSTPSKCASTSTNVEYGYYTSSGQYAIASIPANWPETLMWYYAYVPVPALDTYGNTLSDHYDDLNNKMWGALTRYCLPKYYTASFLPPSTLSAVQTVVPDTVSLFFTVNLSPLDPRVVTSEARYMVGRALTRYILNNGSTDDNYVEILDFNVHMIEGINEKTSSSGESNQSMKRYEGTKFYVQIKVRTTAQFNYALTNIQRSLEGDPVNNGSNICKQVNNDLQGNINKFLNQHVTYKWPNGQKEISICVPTTYPNSSQSARRFLRY